MKKSLLSIIHGAHRIHQPSRFRPSWPSELKRYMLGNGFDHVEIFYWSGSWYETLQRRTAENYAEHLSHFINKYDYEEGRFCIIAKSLGAIVAERGLNLIARNESLDLGVHSFLRLATPDHRKYLSLSNVHSVVDVVSSSDLLYKLSIPITSALIRLTSISTKNNYIPTKRILLQSLSHSAFNTNRIIKQRDIGHDSLYNLYWALLNS